MSFFLHHIYLTSGSSALYCLRHSYNTFSKPVLHISTAVASGKALYERRTVATQVNAHLVLLGDTNTGILM